MSVLLWFRLFSLRVLLWSKNTFSQLIESSLPWLPCADGPSWYQWTPCRTAGHHGQRQRSWRWCLPGDVSAWGLWPHTPLLQTHLVAENEKMIILAICSTQSKNRKHSICECKQQGSESVQRVFWYLVQWSVKQNCTSAWQWRSLQDC